MVDAISLIFLILGLIISLLGFTYNPVWLVIGVAQVFFGAVLD